MSTDPGIDPSGWDYGTPWNTGQYLGPTTNYTVDVNHPVPLDGGGTQMLQLQSSGTQGPYVFNVGDSLQGMTPQEVNFWQQALIMHNYMDARDANWDGHWTKQGRTEFQNAVVDANWNRMPLSDYLFFKQKDWNAQYGPQAAPTSTSTSHSESSSTSTSINLTTRSGARALLVTALSNEIGREPSPDEVNRFLDRLNRDERQHASTSTNHSVSDSTSTSSRNKTGGTDSTSDSTSTSDSNSTSYTSSPAQMATNFARRVDKAEWQRYQGGRYMNVLDQLVGM